MIHVQSNQRHKQSCRRTSLRRGHPRTHLQPRRVNLIALVGPRWTFTLVQLMKKIHLRPRGRRKMRRNKPRPQHLRPWSKQQPLTFPSMKRKSKVPNKIAVYREMMRVPHRRRRSLTLIPPRILLFSHLKGVWILDGEWLLMRRITILKGSY